MEKIGQVPGDGYAPYIASAACQPPQLLRQQSVQWCYALD